jgi:trimeric autotransporter adhesin
MGLVEPIFGICRNRSRLELYDVIFGGIEQMTKRFTIALVALAMLVLATVMPVSAYWDANRAFYVVTPYINQGATVFIGEQNLDITAAVTAAQGDSPAAAASTTLGWWGYDADIYTTSATWQVPVAGVQGDFWIDQDNFDGREGNWYLVGANGFAVSNAVFTVQHPTMQVTIRNPNLYQGADVTGKSVPTGTPLDFRIGTNMYTATLDSNLRSDTPYPPGSISAVADNPYQIDGYIDLVVKTESNTILSSLCNTIDGDNVCTASGFIKGLNVNAQPYDWKSWQTGAIDPNTDQKLYKAGTYLVSAVSKLNNMQNNYLSGGAAYTGRTVTETRSITLVSDTVKITANKDSVVRTNDFSVTITGRPGEYYNVWVKNTANMDLNAANNAPPIVTKGQDRVVVGDCTPKNGYPWSTANYMYQNGGGKMVSNNAYGTVAACVPPAVPTGEYSYASVRLNTAGTWTVGFTTTANTKAQKYTIRVEQNFGDACDAEGCNPNDFKGDEVDVKIEKGAVTIVAAGDQSYFLGEEIKLSGTNSESDTTYLFIVGPNLPENGGSLDFPFNHAICTQNEDDEGICEVGDWNSVYADVLADNTWSYKWGTAAVDLDAGTYTIYAVSQPCDNDRDGCLPNAAFGTVSIIIKKPFVSATASQSTVAKGDRLYITGTAEGQPSSVAIWILGKNYADRVFEPVNADSTFKYELLQATTANLYSGQYFVVVQHPMQNGVFDIDTDIDNPQNEGSVYVYDLAFDSATNGDLCNMAGGECYSIFKLVGQGALQGSDAAEALVTGINQPYIDDTYTKLQFLIEEPVITIIPIGDKRVGDKFTISALTNLAVDDEILVEVYSSSFKPTQKSQSGEFSGATGTVKVQKGETGMNAIKFEVDASTFKPDEYIVTENAVIQEATGTALFNVLEAAPPTAVPTPVVTTVAPTTIATPIPTTVPPTPTPTKSPGYGALIALIGLGAVAFIVVRRH